MTLSRLVVKNTLRNKRRSLLTVISVAVSLLLLTFLISIWRLFYLEQPTEKTALRLITRHRVSMAILLPMFYRERIRTIPGVAHVVPLSWVGNRYKDDRPENMFAQFATDPEEIFKVYPEDRVDPAQYQAWIHDRNGVAVTRSLARKHGWKLGDRIFLSRNLYPIDLDLTVRAIYDAPPLGEGMCFDIRLLGEAMPIVKDKADMFVLLVDSPQSVPRVAAAVDEMFRNSPQPTHSESEKAFELDFLATLGNIKAFILSISTAVVFAILLVVANTIAMSIRERTREVAVLKTLGFDRTTILGLFVAEAVLLAITGGIIGTLGAKLLIASIASSPKFAIFAAFFAGARVRFPTMAAGLLTATAVGLLSALLPSYHASRRSIVDGLRHIG
jgi:putative ABC transport system permease protein